MRGFATVLALIVVLLASGVVAGLQTWSYAQASEGREALARVRAYWAARAGVEATLARLEQETESPTVGDAFAVVDAMVEVADGTTRGATWTIETEERGKRVQGPADAHAKLNINTLSAEQMLTLDPPMGEDIADSVLDWIDADDDTNPLGAEAGYYQSRPQNVVPRNGPMRSIAELELVAGVDQEDVRGEDWNLNGVLDPNENDGDLSWPPDNADGVLDAGWSGVLTAASVGDVLGASGQARIDLSSTQAGELVSRIAVSQEQADAIVDYAQSGQATSIAEFIQFDLAQLQDLANGAIRAGTRVLRPQGFQRSRVDPLTEEQLGALLNEAAMSAPGSGPRPPGALNINTCAAETLQYLPQLTPELADAIVAERSSRPEGFTSVADLLSVEGMSRTQLAGLYSLFTTRSNVFVVCSRGRDNASGLEVEIVATLDRSDLPVVLREVMVR
jgi:DNA uptake protein ComE-like DNA-binding protein